MTDIKEPNKDLIKMACEIVRQNSEILSINKVLIKLFSAPTIHTERKEND